MKNINSFIESILLDKKQSTSNKKRELNHLKSEIEFALDVLEGDWRFCNECGDYYKSASFFEEKEEKKEKICTYSSPINSGSDEYEERMVNYTYIVCPKGHRVEVLERVER